MSIVVDEFGGVSGLVTVKISSKKSLVKLRDEFDDEEVDIRKLSKHTFAVKALTTIEDFSDTFETSFSDDEVDTVGGMVMTALGHLPVFGKRNCRNRETTISKWHQLITVVWFSCR